MTKSEKKNMLAANACLWVAAILLPVICHFGFASSKFPWPVVASNQMLSRAIGEPAEDPEMKAKK